MQSFFPADDLTFTQGFLTDHEQALETLYAEDAENSRHFNICLNMMATRIATVFASLKVHTFCITPERESYYVFLLQSQGL